MASDSEGMVAVVQGLKDAGLMVTMTKNNLLYSPMNFARNVAIYETDSHCYSGLQANQASQVEVQKCSNGFQTTSCSPPISLTEVRSGFPLQRTDPSYIKGHFITMAGYNGGMSNCHHQMRNDARDIDRKEILPVRGSSPTDFFANSLRKYPVPVDSSVSTEMVQKFLDYTQAKHLTKSQKSLQAKSDVLIKCKNVTPKTVHKVSQDQDIPTRDNGAHALDLKRCPSKSKRKYHSSRNKHDQTPDSYNYLNTTPCRDNSRRSEVRFLNTLTKSVKDTLKQFLDENATVCPTMKSRYINHKKSCQRRTNEIDLRNCNECKGSPCKDSYECTPPLDPYSPNCCHCNKTSPCTCVCPYTNITTDDDEQLTKKLFIEYQIEAWLKEVPISANENTADKRQRTEVIIKLNNALQNLIERNEIDKAREYIDDCVENLPMWYPNADDKSSFKNDIANKLYNRVIKVENVNKVKEIIIQCIEDLEFDADFDKNEKIDEITFNLMEFIEKPELKEEILKNLDLIPIANKKHVINDIGNQIYDNIKTITPTSDDKLEDIVIEWIDEVPELPEDIKTDKAMLNNIVTTLNRAKNNPNANKEIKIETSNWIDTVLKRKGEKLYSKTKDIAAEKLVRIYSKAFKLDESGFDKQAIQNSVKEWLENIPGFKDLGLDNTDVINFINEIENIPSDDQEKHIIKFLNSNFVNLSPNEKKELTKKLITKINKVPRKKWSVKTDLEAKDIKKSIYNKVYEILEQYPIDENIKDDLIQDTVSLITEQIKRGIDQKKMREQINSLLKSANLNDTDIDNIANQLLDGAKDMNFGRDPSIPFTTQSASIDTLAQREIDDFIDNKSDVSPKDRKKIKEDSRRLSEAGASIETLAQREINGFIDNISDDISPKDRKKIREDSRRLSKAVAGIILESTENIHGKVGNEVGSFVRRLSIKPDTKDNFAKELTDKLVDLSTQATFEKRAEKEIEDFVYGMYDDISPRKQEQLRDDIKEMKNTLIPIISDDNAEQKMIDTIVPFIRKLSINSDVPRERLAKQLTDRLINIKHPVEHHYSLEKIAETEIQSLVDEVSIEISPKEKEKVRNDVRKLSKTISPIMSKAKTVERKMMEKIVPFTKELPTDLPKDELAINLTKKLMSSDYKSSTPKRLSRNEGFGNLDVSPILQDEQTYTNELTDIIKDWADDLKNNLKIKENFSETLLKNLANDIIERKNYLQLNPDVATPKEEVEHLKFQLFKTLNKSLDKNELNKVLGTTETLLDKINDIHLPEQSKNSAPFKKAADLLLDGVNTTVNEIPISVDSPEEVNKIKHDLQNKILHKVNELNMNPEIFKDDFLFVDILEDEVDNLLSELPIDLEKSGDLDVIKKKLVNRVKEARERLQEEIAGQEYRQRLRDVLTETLPQSLSAESEASFETLKDSLADAFISLNYFENNEDQKSKYKQKIKNEIDRFCNTYLEKHPQTPINSEELNKRIFEALNNIPVPKEDTIRNEVDFILVKEKIADWVNELPLSQNTEKLHINKIINVLSKKIHDIELEKLSNPYIDVDEKIKKEIKKWLSKHFNQMDDTEIDAAVKKLIVLLTKQDRSPSNTRSERSTSQSKRNSKERFKDMRPTCISRPCSPCIPKPCQLSCAEKAILQRIRRPCFRNICTDASSNTCDSRTCNRRNFCSQTLPQTKSNQSEVSPNVIVKEFWEPSTRSINLSEKDASAIVSPQISNVATSSSQDAIANAKDSLIANSSDKCFNARRFICNDIPRPCWDLPKDCSDPNRCKYKDNYWNKRRRVIPSRDSLDPKCKCKNRAPISCAKSRMSQYEERNRCGKCSVNRCPFPSYMFFK